jgi:glycosyltransferase involved in cell wall biosynthesis
VVSRGAPRSLSIFFPAYNDAPSIGRLVERADRAARRLADDYEIIVVDDGSSDDTQAVLEALAASLPRLRVIRHATNRGYGGALRSGFQAARHDAVFYTDGDGQYDPGELESLWQALGQGADFAQGFKRRRSDSLHRVAIGALYRSAVRVLFGLRVRDVDCDFRLIRREVLQRIALSARSGAICVELVRKAQDTGACFVEVPVHHYPRLHGRSHAFRPAQVAHMLRELWRLWRELT